MVRRADITTLVEDAFNTIREQIGLEAALDIPLQDPDGAAVTIKMGRRVWHFNIVVKPWINKPTIGLTLEKIRGGTRKGLLITRYVAPGQADDLRTMGLPFLDTMGNAFLVQDGLYVFIKGQRTGGYMETQPGNLFRPAELKVLFAFLSNEGLVARTHEQIREMSGASIGTINRFLHALRVAGYTLKLKGRDRRLVRKKELLEQWVMAYSHRLRPQVMMGRFKGPREQWWMKRDAIRSDDQWGGEIAGKYLTHYLHPQAVTIYAVRRPDELLMKHRLSKDAHGDIEILKRFWNFPTTGETTNLVPPLLVYADLIATGDDRNIETAQMVYDRYLRHCIEGS